MILYRDHRDRYGRYVRPQVVSTSDVEWVKLESGRQTTRLTPTSIFIPRFVCRICGDEPTGPPASTYHSTMLCRRCRFGSKRDAGRE